MQTATATTGGGYAPGEQVPDDIFASLSNTVNQSSPANTGAVPINPTDTQVAARQAATEPAVVTSDTIANTVIPDNTTKLASVAQKGTYVGQDGNTYYSDGSVVPAPVGAEFDPTTSSWKDASGSYASGPQYVNNPNNDPDIAQTNSILASLKASTDSSTFSTINAIEQQFETLIQQQKDFNGRADSARQQTLLLGGTSRYAPLAAAGVTLAQTSYGLQQVQNLEAQENSAIAQAKQAQQTNNMALMDKALSTIDSIRTQKQDAAQKVADQLKTANDALLAKRQQATQDEAIADIYASGVTDPAAILSAAKAAGLDTVTADQVAGVIKDITPTSVAGDVYKFTTADTGKLLGAGLNAASIKALSDYYNGRSATPPSLTDAQGATVQQILTGKGAGDGTAFTTSQINTGAAHAGVPLATFKGYDQDTQNVFINGNVDGTKKTIDTAFTNGGDLDSVTASIKEMGLPQGVEDYFTKYATAQAAVNAPLTPDQQKSTISSVITDLKTSEYTRDEAKAAVLDKMTNGGKTTLPAALQKVVDDSLDEVYKDDSSGGHMIFGVPYK